MFDACQFRDLIVKPTLIELDHVLPGAANPAAMNLLIGTCWQESHGGTYLKQLGSGPALGVYQIEPATHADIWHNYIVFRTNLQNFLGKFPQPEQALAYNLRYATQIARIKYYRRRFTWPEDPNDIDALAVIWDDHYNANPKHGFPEQFAAHFPREVLG